MDSVISHETKDAWLAELSEELATTRAILVRIAKRMKVNTSSNFAEGDGKFVDKFASDEWPACRLAYRIEQKLRRDGHGA